MSITIQNNTNKRKSFFPLENKMKRQKREKSTLETESIDLGLLTHEAFEKGGLLGVSEAFAEALIDESGVLDLEQLKLLIRSFEQDQICNEIRGHRSDFLDGLKAILACKELHLPPPRLASIHPFYRELLEPETLRNEKMTLASLAQRSLFSMLFHPLRQENGGYCYAIGVLKDMMRNHPEYLHRVFYTALLMDQILDSPLQVTPPLSSVIDLHREKQSDHMLSDFFVKLLVFSFQNYTGSRLKLERPLNKVLPFGYRNLILHAFFEELESLVGEEDGFDFFSNFLFEELKDKLFLYACSKSISNAPQHAGGFCWIEDSSVLYLTSYQQIEKVVIRPLLKLLENRSVPAKMILESHSEELGQLMPLAVQRVLESKKATERILSEQPIPLIPWEGGGTKAAAFALFGHLQRSHKLQNPTWKEVIEESRSMEKPTVRASMNGHAFELYPSTIPSSLSPLKRAKENFLKTQPSPSSLDRLKRRLKIKKHIKKKLTWGDVVKDHAPTSKKIVSVEKAASEFTVKTLLDKQLGSILERLGIVEKSAKNVQSHLVSTLKKKKRVKLVNLVQLLSDAIFLKADQFTTEFDVRQAISFVCQRPLHIQVGDSNYLKNRRDGGIYLTESLNESKLVAHNPYKFGFLDKPMNQLVLFKTPEKKNSLQNSL